MASAQGLLTGMLTACLDNSSPPSYFYTVMYYGSYGRSVQSKSSNHLTGGTDKEYIAYNFVGQPVRRKHIHSLRVSLHRLRFTRTPTTMLVA